MSGRAAGLPPTYPLEQGSVPYKTKLNENRNTRATPASLGRHVPGHDTTHSPPGLGLDRQTGILWSRTPKLP